MFLILTRQNVNKLSGHEDLQGPVTHIGANYIDDLRVTFSKHVILSYFAKNKF